ncbi:YigZ family protein [Rhodocytophaga aerolata]|uniref:YigZ family protein n=1 Tax=Rhodocytophaga aerolata TaxID=455078 RepID=A0ABT8R4D6_9BACT|nr:YigZ family protein [Rhodocytophaga aerolata]MDO1446794.1 YigZ family protein [Rhodocytophaga aerolata]
MPEPDTFLTIAFPVEGLYKEKGSKFIALAYPVASEEEVKELIAQARKQYYDARHHCYAYMIGEQGQHYRANDDGEPSHSAGDPILGQIRSRNLTQVLVIVVRYFGGTKLGVGGLIHAYKTATADALDKAAILQKIIPAQVIVHFGYDWMNAVMKLVKDYEMDVISQDFTDTCHIRLSVRKSLVEEVKAKFALLDVEVA